jgi:hypothetical protein
MKTTVLMGVSRALLGLGDPRGASQDLLIYLSRPHPVPYLYFSPAARHLSAHV